MNTAALPGETHYVALVYLKSLVDYLQADGHPIGPVLDALGVTEHDLGNPDCFVPTTRQSAAFAAAEAITGDHNIGLHVGLSMHPANLGVLGHLLMTCTHASQLLEIHTRYAPIISNDTRADYALTERGLEFTVRGSMSGSNYTRHLIEFNVAGWLTLYRWIAGRNHHPLLIRWPFAKPTDTGEQQRLFQCPMEYQADGAVSIVFDLDQLAQPLSNGQPQLRTLVEPQVRRQLNQVLASQTGTDALVARTRRHIAGMLSQVVPELPDVATALGLSPRQLQRHFEAHGTHFREQLDDVRRELATAYISDERLPLADIALMLGFAEQSAFQRAFKRWFERTPMEYRRIGQVR